MTQQAIDRARPESSGRDFRARPGPDAQTHRDAPTTPRWLKLGLAGALGIVAGAMLFPTRAEGAPPGRGGTRRPGP
ncbi:MULTISPECIES: hypothetical protein [unclassified Methylobacterium]|jgi:hypothetical protein|uniref:hypothetical protein n=1 Tax=unclassified Methylobacterium TaxID=2615210 RepID=UPI0006F4D4E8|nr:MULTISPECIES: hypothetical protein [unclassified Methylobacterium]KQO69983.1 hypothetical protein ASF20_19650 [Methylobacterium sp. Leaf88]KQP76919.1 hypothetical protein ASF41_03985 [Methylobacterium sp. Leaf111]KQU27426.1 hypothetical protein ASG63_01995 [Methylobacterium sp. Leaf94]